MGNDCSCTLRYQGKSFSGKALLETAELFFRGETRLKIPFSSITALHAQDGALHVRTKEGLAIFDLGSQAEKWRQKIANPKSLLDKLGVKPGDHVSVVGNFPAGFLADLNKQGVLLAQSALGKDSAWVFLEANSPRQLALVKPIAKSLRGAAALWIVYPKGQKSITENDVRSSGLAAGLTDIKVASFNPTHTALKFVIPKSKR